MKLNRLWAPVLCAFGIFVQPCLGAEGTGTREEVQVSAVEVPVYVTDRSGAPVADLRPEDFVLYQDGKKQRLDSATRIVLAQPTASNTSGSAAANTEDLPSPVVSTAGRHFVLFFDMIFNDVNSLGRARNAAWHMALRQIPSNEPVAVFAISRASGVTMCCNFTTDRALIERALATLGSDDSKKRHDESAGLAPPDLSESVGAEATGKSLGMQSGLGDGMDDALLDEFYDNPEHLTMIERFDRDTYRQGVRDYAADLRSFACSLGVFPGRKIVLFFSTGFDSSVGFFSTTETAMRSDSGVVERATSGDRFLPKGEFSVMDAVSSAMACFAGSDCRLHCISTAGIDASGDPGAATSRIAALEYMASEAGGEVVKNTNDLQKPLGSIIERTQQYYLLIYTPPPEKRPDAFHDIKVEVTRPGMRIAYRRGFFAGKEFHDYTPLERDLNVARLVGLGVDLAGIPFTSQAYCFPTAGGTAKEADRVVLQVRLSGEEVSRLTKRSVEIYAFAIDAAGRTCAFLHAKPDLAADDIFARARGGGLTYTDTLKLAPGRYDLKVVVRDPETGVAGVVNRSLTVRAFDIARLRVATPCFLATGGALNLRGGPWAEKAETRNDYPLTFQSKTLVAASAPALSGAQSFPLLLKIYNASTDASAHRPLVQINWRVRPKTGTSAGAPACELLNVNTETPGCAEMLFSVKPPTLAPGSYLLSADVRATDGDQSDSAEVEFQISSAALH